MNDNDFSEVVSASYELGQIMGQRRAFGAVAGRCSAASVAAIKRIRDEKLFQHFSETWEEFCPRRLGMTKSNANRLIHQLDEFGPEFFQISEFTRITTAEYRALAPSIADGKLHRNGDAIELIAENSDKVAEAVAELREAARNAGPPGGKPPLETLRAIEGRGRKLAEDYAELLRAVPSVSDRARIAETLKQLHGLLFAVERENR